MEKIGDISVIINLNAEQAIFLQKGLGVIIPAGKDVEIDRELRDKIALYALDVEIFEAMDADEENRELSKKGRIAVSLVDMVPL